MTTKFVYLIHNWMWSHIKSSLYNKFFYHGMFRILPIKWSSAGSNYLQWTDLCERTRQHNTGHHWNTRGRISLELCFASPEIILSILSSSLPYQYLQSFLLTWNNEHKVIVINFHRVASPNYNYISPKLWENFNVLLPIKSEKLRIDRLSEFGNEIITHPEYAYQSFLN